MGSVLNIFGPGPQPRKTARQVRLEAQERVSRARRWREGIQGYPEGLEGLEADRAALNYDMQQVMRDLDKSIKRMERKQKKEKTGK